MLWNDLHFYQQELFLSLSVCACVRKLEDKTDIQPRKEARRRESRKLRKEKYRKEEEGKRTGEKNRKQKGKQEETEIESFG